MHFKNQSHKYGLVAIIFHWTMALLIIGMLAVGLYMVRMPISLEKLKIYGWHKEFGALVLALAILRFVWKISNISPTMADYLAPWQKFAAQAMHLGFYGFMVVLPLTGWMMSNAAGLPVSFFGLFVLPNPIQPNKELHHLLRLTHEYLAYGLIAALVGHIGAVVQHYVFYKDNILKRMLP